MRLRHGLRDRDVLMMAGSWRRGRGCGWGAERGGRRLRGPLLGCVRPCDHAATISSSTFLEGAPDSVHRQWLDIPVMRAETSPHSANCAADCRDSSGAAHAPVLDMPVIVQRRCAVRGVKVVDISVVAQMQFPLVLLFIKP